MFEMAAQNLPLVKFHNSNNNEGTKYKYSNKLTFNICEHGSRIILII